MDALLQSLLTESHRHLQRLQGILHQQMDELRSTKENSGLNLPTIQKGYKPIESMSNTTSKLLQVVELELARPGTATLPKAAPPE